MSPKSGQSHTGCADECAKYRVAALYVDRLGIYPEICVDWWDEQRDARNYAGPLPVVAHPPCGSYGTLRKLDRGHGKECGPIAFGQIRRWGGVLEQPRGSRLFALCGAPRPGELPDVHGGVTIEVEQVRWGHPAKKATWLYLVGVRDADKNPPAAKPTHWCSGSQREGDRGKPPPGIKICSAQQRRRTPLAFAHFLCQLAEQAKP